MVSLMLKLLTVPILRKYCYFLRICTVPAIQRVKERFFIYDREDGLDPVDFVAALGFFSNHWLQLARGKAGVLISWNQETYTVMFKRFLTQYCKTIAVGCILTITFGAQ